MIKSRRMKLAQYITSMDNMKNAWKILVGESERKRIGLLARLMLR
jgi:hypothetical protein